MIACSIPDVITYFNWPALSGFIMELNLTKSDYQESSGSVKGRQHMKPITSQPSVSLHVSHYKPLRPVTGEIPRSYLDSETHSQYVNIGLCK
jgi:hypothetical protein